MPSAELPLEHPVTWGDFARNCRISKGFTVKALAKRSGVSVFCINSFESNKHAPVLTSVVWLAMALNVSIDEYIGHTIGGA